MALGAWLLFYSDAGGTPPPIVLQAIGLTTVLYVAGHAYEATLGPSSYVAEMVSGPSYTSALASNSFAGDLIRERL